MTHNFGAIIRSIPALTGAPDNFVVEMAQVSNHRLFGPKDVISHQGLANEAFYVLRKGEVVICRVSAPKAPREFVSRLRNTGYWNERLLVYNSWSDCAVKAISFVEVVTFDSAIVRGILKRFPNGLVRVKQIVIWKLWRCACSKYSMDYGVQRYFQYPVRIDNEIRRKSDLKALAAAAAPMEEARKNTYDEETDSSEFGSGDLHASTGIPKSRPSPKAGSIAASQFGSEGQSQLKVQGVERKSVFSGNLPAPAGRLAPDVPGMPQEPELAL